MYHWRARNYKTKHEEFGDLGTIEAAKEVAYAAKVRLGFRETVAEVTTPTGIVYQARPAERGSGIVWDRVS